MHLNLNVDPKQADQNIRDMVVLPSGSGKSLKVAVLADGDDADKAQKAGADLTGVSDILAKLDKEQIDFDLLIALPSEMAKLGKYAKLLGPRGLMPNPKSGTVTNDVARAVSEAKTGRVEYRLDSQGIVHLPIGKVSFGPGKLALNAEAVLASIRSAKPATVKGSLIRSVYLSSTMGPSVKIDV
jgi:large subunit ribosomal protein L1